MTAKSFRAAADRVVRQEYSSAIDALRLLGATDAPPQRIANEGEAWELRLASLAALGEYDALAVLASRPAKFSYAYNVDDPAALAQTVAACAEEVVRHGAAIQLRSSLTLADGRTGTSMLVVPLNGVAEVDGTLVALRAGRGFGAADLITGRRVSSLLALEVTRRAADAQDARTRREALALFEIARIGLSSAALRDKLDAIVEMLAGSLGHDVAQLWLLRAGGSLRLGAAHPRESLVLEIARPRDHEALTRALGGEVLLISDASLRAWVRRTTRNLIVAPLGDDAGVSGVLILGRWREGHADDELDLARVIAGFIARILTPDARDKVGTSAAELEEDPADSLTGS
jgi:GAF domain-containing protein